MAPTTPTAPSAGCWEWLECTAVYINTADIYSDKAVTAPVYVLTNAHCLATQNPNEVVLDRPMKGYKVIFNYFVEFPAGADRHPGQDRGILQPERGRPGGPGAGQRPSQI